MTSRQKDQPALIISNLVKDFGRKRAVDDVSMEIYPGEVFWLFGAEWRGQEHDDSPSDGFYQPDQRLRDFTRCR